MIIVRLGVKKEGGYRLTVSKHDHEHNQSDDRRLVNVYMYSEVNNHDDDGGGRVAI